MVIIAQRRAGQCALERREGRADDPDTPAVRPFDQLPVAGDQRFQGGRCGIPGKAVLGPGNVVDAEHHHHAACAWLGQYRRGPDVPARFAPMPSLSRRAPEIPH